MQSSRGGRVLDLGSDWSVDVSIDEIQPSFVGSPSSILIRSDTCFFILLNKDEGFLNLDTGYQVDNRPDPNSTAYWSRFAIRLRQTGVDGPGEVVFRWPQEP